VEDEDDFALLRAWRSGDAGAGDRLVERHFDRLYRFFRAHVDDGIADLVQRTWTACVEKRDRIPEGVKFRAFLFGVAHKELLMHLRKHYRGQRAMTKVAASAAAPVTTPSQAVAVREQEQLLRWALGRIPMDSRLALELFYWEELSIDEVAGVLEVPSGTVKSRLHRARSQLREAMEAAGAEPELVESTVQHLETVARNEK
jgi:RNA polymerase sigma-70 factor (ECF subfamily)